jgi:hypothetical protein
VTGRQIRKFWEDEIDHVFATDPARRFGGWLPRPSGMSMRFDSSAPAGQRVREILVGDAPLEDERTYTITACEREGDVSDRLCRIDGVKDAKVLEIDAHEAVRSYLKRHPHVSPKREGRVVAIDLSRELRTQMSANTTTP